MFKLTIESTKDITSLNINFADGTSEILESSETKGSNGSKESKESKGSGVPKSLDQKNIFSEAKNELLGGLLDTEAYDSDPNPAIEQVVKKPEITPRERAPKVADELQNFEL